MTVTRLLGSKHPAWAFTIGCMYLATYYLCLFSGICLVYRCGSLREHASLIHGDFPVGSQAADWCLCADVQPVHSRRGPIRILAPPAQDTIVLMVRRPAPPMG